MSDNDWVENKMQAIREQLQYNVMKVDRFGFLDKEEHYERIVICLLEMILKRLMVLENKMVHLGLKEIVIGEEVKFPEFPVIAPGTIRSIKDK